MNRRQLLMAFIGQPDGLFSYGHEDVLGTSLDLHIRAAHQLDADRAEAAALAEIDRLRAVLSTWDPNSEASRWLRSSNEPIRVSADLWAVLRAYDLWRERSLGIVDPAVGAAAALWEAGTVPTPSQRAAAVAQMRQRHWELDPARQTATRLSTTPHVFASLAKGYVIAQAADAAMAAAPIRGLTVNLGGDILVRGDLEQTVEVRDPHEGTAARLLVSDQAVATSGDYRRGYTIDGERYSHLLDPRTATPAAEVRSATVIAADPVTAGALATAMATGSIDEGRRLAQSVDGAEYLLLAANGRRLTSPGWAAFAAAQGPAKPAEMELAVNFEIARVDGQRYRRPYVAVWIEDGDHFPLRTLSLWVEKPRWWPDLKSWYRGDKLRAMAEGTETTAASATRSPGKYTVKWDGKDAKGVTVKPGKYAVCIEAAREHGTYQLIRYEMEFNGTPKTVPLPGNVEIASASLEYRKAAR